MSGVISAVTVDEFHHLLSALNPPVAGRLGLAVSGGPDSMALACLVRNWAERQQQPLPLSLIVDHGLRPESADEAAQVKKNLARLGLEAEILRWDHAALSSRLHHLARKARYRLLVDACHKHALSGLLFGHQREDQAETVLMRWSKGSGIDGLAGIPAVGAAQGVKIFRPLLTLAKSRLIATCAAAGVPFVSDPSNHLEKFARGRLRQVMPLLEKEGLTIERLLDGAARAAEARDALEFYTQDFLRRHAALNEYGVASIDQKELGAVPRAVALRALAHLLQSVHAEDYDPPHASLGLLLDGLHAETFLPRTLHGCLLSCRQGRLMVTREESAIRDIVLIQGGETVLWDGRWHVSLGTGEGEYRVRALGHPPHDALDRLAPGLRRHLPQGRARAALPALWLGDRLALVPFGPNQERSRARLG